nr:hypothetical protein CFP56_70462 [Quercus suber]
MRIYLTLPSEPEGSIPPCCLPCHSLGLCSFLEIGNYEVWLTVAAVGMLKTIDNDIPVLLEAYTTLKSDVVCKEIWWTTPKVFLAGLLKSLAIVTLIGTLIKERSSGFYK